MDPKLLCPTLTIMLTKTIKALCEVNIKFDKKLEISGSLHVRSDGEKILTCLIDEDSSRSISGGLLQQRSTPETALAQQSAVMALLTASQQMAANRSPGLSSPPARNGTPADLSHFGDSVQQLNMSQQHLILQNASKASHPSNSIQHTSTQEITMEQHALPPVNSLIHPSNDREVLLGMLQDKSKKSTEVLPSQTTQTNTAVPQHVLNSHLIHVQVKKEPSECVSSQVGSLVSSGVVRCDPQASTQPSITTTQTTTANGAILPPMSALPPFPVLVGGAFAPSNMSAIGTATTATPKSDPESPPRENEYVTTINSKGQKKFQCMFCGILLSTKNYLKNHINAVHTKARVYPCEICERYFYSAGALRIHKLRHHWAGSKKHKCLHCQESFLLPVELRRHLVKKHGDTSSGHSEDEGAESPRGSGRNSETSGNVIGSGGLTIQQIHQMQLREQLRAQQHLYEQEQAIHNLQKQISEQNSPVEMCSRGDSVSEEREPGELLNEDLHTQVTVTVANAIEDVHSVEHALMSRYHPVVTSMNDQVIVQPEAPTDIVNSSMEIELHSNQNETGVCVVDASSG